MSRGAVRWIALGALLIIAVVLGFRTADENSRLIRDLQSLEESVSARAFATYSERQDAFNFLRAEDVAVRREVADNLADWSDPRAAKVAMILAPDPDPEVRAGLVRAVAESAVREPTAVASHFSVTGAAEVGVLLDGCTAASSVSVLNAALEADPHNANAFLLARRLGPKAFAALSRVLETGDDLASSMAAEVLAAQDPGADVGRIILRRFEAIQAGPVARRLYFALAEVAPLEAREIFVRTAFDDTAPTDLRKASTEALVRLQDNASVSRLRNDPDSAVAGAASGR